MNESNIMKHRNELIAAEPVLYDINEHIESILLIDKPDIKVKTKEGVVFGIEVIECHPLSIKTNKKRSLTHAYKKIDYACEQCTQKFKNENREHEYGYVYFTEEAYNTRLSPKEFSSIVVEEIERHIRNDQYLSNPHLLGWEKYKEMRKEGLFDYQFVEGIDIQTELSLSTAILPSHAYWVKDMNDSYINHCLKEKEKKLVEYKKMVENKDVTEYWLVINLPFLEEYDFENYVQQASLNTQYERVYLTKWSHKLRLK